MTRGHKTIQELAIEAYSHGFNYVLVICEKRGNPSKIDIYKVNINGQFINGIKIYSWVLKGVRLSREIPGVSRIYNPKSVYVDYSQCISNDCFLIADTMINIFRKIITENMYDLKIVLNDSKYITISWLRPDNRVTGPRINVLKVIDYERQGHGDR
ncbi:MAG: ribosomal biogenesis protein [Desulfurococcaceae archaeon]